MAYQSLHQWRVSPLSRTLLHGRGSNGPRPQSQSKGARAMTKRDYQRIARAISEVSLQTEDSGPARAAVSRIISSLADELQIDNPRFHRQTFIDACESGDVSRRPPRATRAHRSTER